MTTNISRPASGTLTEQVYDALARFDRLTIDDIAATFDVSRRDAGDAVMQLLNRSDIVEVGAGIRRLGDCAPQQEMQAQADTTPVAIAHPMDNDPFAGIPGVDEDEEW